MKVTKSGFEAIADAVSKTRMSEPVRISLVDNLTAAMVESNKRFNKEKFQWACGVWQCPLCEFKTTVAGTYMAHRREEELAVEKSLNRSA